MQQKHEFFLLALFVFFSLFSRSSFAQGQDHKKLIIGILPWGTSSEYDRNIQGFKDALAEAGFIEGKNVSYIIKNAEGNFDSQVKFTESLIKEKVSLIYTLTTPGTLAAKSVTKDVPIVFSVVTYPVEAGVIDSLISSGNNLVGTRNYIPASRQYFFFEKVFPHAKTMAFVHSKAESNSVIQFDDFRRILAKRKINVVDIAAVDIEDMRGQLEANIDRVDACYAACDTLIQRGGQDLIIEISKKYNKPSFTCLRDGVLKGALIGDVADFYQIGKVSGQKAVLILQGVKPAQMLTESPEEDYILVNKATADELGFSLSDDILKKAKEIIK